VSQKLWWFTGLSGSGKTTTANALRERLIKNGKKCIILDGDIVRTGLCRDLEFTKEDRLENLRRVSHVAKMFWDEGYNVICSFVSPTVTGRDMVATLMADMGIDVYVVYFSTPLEECERRDVKGLYKRARAGEIPNFTGIGQAYEEPVYPYLTADTRYDKLEDIVDELSM
jgi:adenylyl-sulfate kinase